LRTETSWKRSLALEVGAFGFFGLFWGCFAVLLADLSGALGLSPGPLGVALFVGAASSIVAMGALGWASDRLGRKAYLILATCLFGAGVSGLALSGSYAALLATLVVLYSSSGLYDVGINAVAVDLERLSERRLMSYLHAAFSGGAMAGALGAGALRQAGVDYRLVYLVLLVPLVVLVAAFAAARFPRPATREAEGDLPPKGDGVGRWALYRNGPLLLVAAIACLSMLAEGEMEHWSGIYLRDTLGLAAIVGGSGVAVFYGAQALGRLAIGRLVGRLGNRRTLLASGVLAAGGMLLALATTSPVLVVGGFVLVGLALAAVAPLAFSVAGETVPERAGSAVSVVTTFGYGGFLLGPPLVGGLAEVVGLRAALGVVAAAGLAVFLLSLRLREAGEDQGNPRSRTP
jgi:MFS family permease